MTRQRLYNPAHLTPDELRESFVARDDTLAEMLRVIGEQPPGRPCQHMMLIGARGMGKTTLGLRFLYAIGEDPELRVRWQPVAFHEESYGIVDMADFWVAALRHLTRATEANRWADRADALISSEGDSQRLAAYALAALTDFSQDTGKRLILFVENIDTVFGQIDDEREVHELRATLIERPEILLLGSANAFFEAIVGYGEPLYEFFRVFKLEGIGQEDAGRILKATVDREGRPDVSETLNRDHGRLETIRRLTGGNPRLLVLACRMLIESPFGSAIEDLERLIDEQTPYFKARIEELPVQARKVFHCLSEGWKPMLAKEVADAAKLSSSHASAQLRQLLERGYVREVRLPAEKRIRYEVSDRFYNIYYLLRFSRTVRERLERLIAFLHELFGSSGMRATYPAALAKLRADGTGPKELSDLLGVLARYVASDLNFESREDWKHQARKIASERIGPNAPVIREIEDAFARDPHEVGDEELILRARKLIDEGHLPEAESYWRRVIDDQPHVGFAWLAIGSVLVRQGRFEAAIASLERAAERSGPDDSELRVACLVLKAEALFAMDRNDDAIAALDCISKGVDSEVASVVTRRGVAVAYFNSGVRLAVSDRYEEAIVALQRSCDLVGINDGVKMRSMAAESFETVAWLLYALNRHEQAIDARKRVADYIRADDSEQHREVAVRAFSQNGDVLFDLGRYDEAARSWRRIASYVRKEDSAAMRHMAVRGAFLEATGAVRPESRNVDAACRLVYDHVRSDDAPELRYSTAGTMAFAGRIMIMKERYCEAETVFEAATVVDPDVGESWARWAQVIVLQGDAGRLSEAEDHARHAAKLRPRSAGALQTLSDVLALRGGWVEALDYLERSLSVDGDGFHETEKEGLTNSLIRAAAAGHGQWVKRVMEQAGLAERMEPLWHAVRAELGEELEPLPAEVMEAIREVRRRLSVDGGSESEAGADA